MAYVKTNWKDRVVERPNTYTMTDNGNGTVTLTPVPGQIIERGTPLNAENLNKIENAIVETNTQLSERTYYLTPEMFGAIGDGVADDTNAFDKMISAIVGRTIIKLSRCYKVNNVNLPNDTSIVGDNNAKLVKLSDNLEPLISSKGSSNIVIKDIELDDNGYQIDFVIDINNLQTTQVNNIKIEGIRYTAKNQNGKGIIVGYVDGLTIRDCKLSNTNQDANEYSFGIAVWSDQNVASNMMSKNIIIENNHVTGFYRGINSYGTGNKTGGNRQRFIIRNNIVEDSLIDGIHAYHSPRSIIQGNHVINCGRYGIHSDSGQDVESSGLSNQHGNIVDSNIIVNCGIGIHTEEVSRGLITNNSVSDCVYYGICISGGTKYSNVNNNTITNCGIGLIVDKTLTTNVYYIHNLLISNNNISKNKLHGIRVGGVQQVVTIQGNVVMDNGMGGDEYSSGIYLCKDGLEESGSSNRFVVIRGNEIGNGYDISGTEKGEQKYGIRCVKDSTGRLVVDGNEFFNQNTHIYAPYITQLLKICNNYFDTPNISVSNSKQQTYNNIGLDHDYIDSNFKPFSIRNGRWDREHLQMGKWHIWITANGFLRIKDGIPTSDSDGMIVGEQSSN